MTNNLELYKELIRYNCPDFPETNSQFNDKYYVIELIRRGKDNPNMPAANIHYKNYYIFSWHDLEKYWDEIVTACNVFRLRAYASVSWKSKKQVMLNTSATFAKRIALGDYNRPYAIWESESASYYNRDAAIWLIDVDYDECENAVSYIDTIKSVVAECKTKYENAYVMEIPTRSGMHLMYRPFDLKHFENLIKEHNLNIKLSDIKKNHITLLYENL